MSQLESGEVDPSQVVEYQVYDTTVVTTNKQPGQYLHTTVFFIINLFGLGLLNMLKNDMSKSSISHHFYQSLFACILVKYQGGFHHISEDLDSSCSVRPSVEPRI